MKTVTFYLARIALLPFLMLGVNAIAFGYAHFAIQVQRSLNPWGYGGAGSLNLISLYSTYLSNLVKLDLGVMPGGTLQIGELLGPAMLNSLGLFAIAAIISTLIGLLFGLGAINTAPIGIKKWLNPISTLGLATPSFFIATLLLTASIYYVIFFGKNAPPLLPISGMGWDEHLIFPLIALTLRPISQIAQSTSVLLTDELGKQYIMTARAIGNTWKTIRRKHALKNTLSSILVNISASYKLLLAELILVEWIFLWPGLGRLLALCLIPPSTASVSGMSDVGGYFLNPALLAALLSTYAALLYLIDTLFQGLIHWIDPRLQIETQESAVYYG